MMNIYTDKENCKKNIDILYQIAKLINDNTKILVKHNIQLDIEDIKELQYHYKEIINKYYYIILDNVCDNFGCKRNEISRFDNSSGLVFNMADSRFKPIKDMLFNIYRLMKYYEFDNRILDYLSISDNVATINNEEEIINLFTYDTKNDRQKEVTSLLKQIIDTLNKLQKYGISGNLNYLFRYDIKTGNIDHIDKDAIYSL